MTYKSSQSNNRIDEKVPVGSQGSRPFRTGKETDASYYRERQEVKKTMPARVEGPTAGQPSHKLGALKTSFSTTMEPSLQSKKRVEPPFLKTVPAKSDFDGVPLQSKKRVSSPSQKPTPVEPVMQAKKRIMTDFAKTDSSILKPKDDIKIQSKKKVETPENEKPIQCEPPLQSKRRTPGPHISLSNGFHDNGNARVEEYALLGNQDKFSQNVKYKVKPSQYTRESSPPKQMKLQKKYSENQDIQAAPVVNTDKYKQRVTPQAPRQQKDFHDPALQELKKSNLAKEPKVVRSPRTEEPKVTKSPKAVPSSSEVRQSKSKQEEAQNLDRQDPVKGSMKMKRIENMNAFAQTNMDKGVADSAPEAPADYALKYKTGISAPRPTKKVSEYQKQFAWKTGPPASPLLKAEQVVYNSNPQLSPPKKSVIPKVTEYQKQFRAYKLIPVPSQEPEEAPKTKTKLQKSKSMENLSPNEIRPAGSAPVISSNNKRLTLATDQDIPEPVPVVPRRKPRQQRSEYDSNYRSPTRFDYVRGSWHGAAPPQIQMQGPDETTKGPALANWFAEVIELRRKAQEYRQRALGTHFSREHMVQLMAKQNDLWEASTNTARSTLSALSLESGLNCHKQARETNQNARSKAYKEADSTAATLASESDASTGRLSVLNENPPQKKLAWNSQQDDDLGRETPSTFTDDCGEEDGRVSTPKLSDSKRRHHLDRTTPAQGGAILSSPPNMKNARSGKRKFADSISLGTVSPRETPVVHKPLAGQRTYTADRGSIAPTRTGGMPSRDTHALRDDSVLVDQELQTRYIITPVKPTPGGLSVIDEGYGQTYNKSKLNDWTGVACGADVDDDVLSVSMQSIASSCSLASATLERARRRKDEFWGSSGVKAK